MALDAICISALADEISSSVVGGRIDKIYQPERDEIVLGIRTFSESFRLVLCANATYPRVHFTQMQKKNPSTAPLFCMLLRKHLQSGKITKVSQVGFERIIEFQIESYDDLGDLTTKRLIIEIMGRHSNIILVNNEKIVDSIKHIDFTVSSVRQVLPGLLYEYPPKQDKVPVTEAKEINLTSPGDNLEKSVLSSVSGISPLTAREIVYNAYKTTSIKNEQIIDKTAIESSLLKISQSIQKKDFSPCLITDKMTGKLIDFSAIPIAQYEDACEVKYFSSMSMAVDSFYSGRDKVERMRQKSADLVKLLNTHIERAAKKQIILLKTLKDSENKDKYKIFGELLTANIYSIPENSKEAEVVNYYEESMPTVKIPLDNTLSVSENAQRYFKKYQKAKTAQTEAAKQLTECRENLFYLESTLVSVTNAESEADLNAIRTELSEQGYLKRIAAKKKQKTETSKNPMHFISSDGFDIYVGRNNTQNDYLTLKLANSSDIWFHTKNIHGSHTVIKLGIEKDVPDTTMMEAAELAAFYSKARESSQVPVDYTTIKNVKKPSGAKPGMVIYDKYNTVYVTPKKPEM